MVAVKANQAQAFLKSLDKRIVAILVFGSDAGLVSERAREAATRLAQREQPPGEILRIEDTDLDTEPGRLAVELQTVAMFGGARIVRTTASRKVNANLLKPLLVPGAMSGAVVVEAGNLRADEALRKLFEGSSIAAAIPCYADEARDIDAVIQQTLAGLGLRIAQDARQLLVARLGADRALTRSELEKLALYAHGRASIEVEDVEAVVVDASELAVDAILLAASGGNRARALTEFDRALASGEDPQMIVSATQRHFQRLHRLRVGLDAGRSFDDAARGLRPPLFYKQKSVIEAHLRLWDAARLDGAVSRIAKAARDARRAGDLASIVAERLLLELASTVQQGRR